MRIGIREQLAGLVLLCCLVPLVVLSIAIWENNHSFVVGVTISQLALTASLKAAQISSDLLLIQSICGTIVTRVLLQDAVRSFYAGNNTTENWTAATNDIMGALASGGFANLFQVSIFSRNQTGNPDGILNVTSNSTQSKIILPAKYPNGTNYVLGDDGEGYPTELYPNITYTSTLNPDPMDPSITLPTAFAFADFTLNATSVLLLGPLQINQSFALLSITLPLIDNSNSANVLGFMTIVASAATLLTIINSREGLANTGIALIVSTTRKGNLFADGVRPASVTLDPSSASLAKASIKYVFPPVAVPGQADRHSQYNNNLTTIGNSSFMESAYPAVLQAFSSQNSAVNNASALLGTHNENNISVAVGFARPQTTLADWVVLIEQSHDEAWAPINKLRTIVLATVFGAVGLVILFIVPVAHFSVRPIRRLRDATEKSVAPPCYSRDGSIPSGQSNQLDDPGYASGDEVGDEENAVSSGFKRTHGLLIRLKNIGRGGKEKTNLERAEDRRRKVFKIPGEVPDRKHWITDEVSELTTTFNAMSRELLLQYTSLEEKVAERTEQLEISKKAAEAANESKTLFIANISHELKTPLNGILGMCAVCMGEDDLPRIKRSLQIVYKSGDLLLHLLNDLLTFSKNQIGQQLSLEEKEFRLVDIKSQITTIFDKQVRDGRIDFKVRFIGTDTDPNLVFDNEKKLPALGPHGTGRLKDMSLWGDQHRILQVIINLVSNSLKFTPEGGRVEVRIKCLGEAELSSDGNSRNSMGSKQSSKRPSKHRGRNGSGSNTSQISRNSSGQKKKTGGTALQINPMDPSATPRVHVRERSPTPPPPGAKTLLFQFEVQDTGPGIPEAFQERVFEPFVQADLGLSKKFGGTGLGLSICSQLATLMGGAITLSSAEGVGSTFTMKIPLKHTKSRAPSTSSSDIHGGSRAASISSQQEDRPRLSSDGNSPPKNVVASSSNTLGFQKDTQPRLVGLSQPFFAASPSPTAAKSSKEQLAALDNVAKRDGTKLRVLVAEDNLVNQEVVLRMLKLEDVYDVVVAKDGQEAYDIVREGMKKGQFFNLIFMDIQMPNLDGLESTRLIRQMGYSAPIVALTAFAEESNIKQCYDSGMDEFLSKPIRRPALKQVLKKFSTIPEEPETSSLSRKSTPEITTTGATVTPAQISPVSAEAPTINGAP